MTDVLDLRVPEPKAPALIPPPDGRTWKIGTCWKGPPQQRGQWVGELTDARARKLHFDLYGPATAECVIDGRSSQAGGLQELSQDLILSRWDGMAAQQGYKTLFRGPIGRTEDTISETTHTVNVTAADYRAFLGRCQVDRALNYTGGITDQDAIVQALTQTFQYNQPDPGNQGLVFQQRNPDDTVRGNSGQRRDRAYIGSEKVADMVDNLSQVSGGFDWGVDPADPGATTGANLSTAGYLAVWYPQRGVTRTFVAEYGATVASLTRSVNSVDFANWVRNDGQTNTDGTAFFARSYGDIVPNPQLHSEGLWPEGISHADVTVAATLQQQADGELAYRSILVPSYTANLIPGVWLSKATCWLGDTVELKVTSGRLTVDTTVRIIQIDFDIDDAGVERVALTLGRSDLTLSDVMATTRSRLDALDRR